jgi:exodeoxyribonuclease VII large subunit
MEAPKFSPTDFVAAINQTFEFAYPFVDIVGEIANFRVSKGRWVYFDLKDDDASVKFFGTVYTLPGPLEDGMMVRVSGSPRLSPLYGFSVSFQQILPVGEGTLKRAADLLQKKLYNEGLFDPARKRVVPYPPSKIGLVTSAQSAAYRDFVKVLGARWRDVEIVHVDVGVQGEAAVSEVVRAIETLNQAVDIDVVVVTRGGGSADDLAVFSTEPVVRAVAASRIPTVVAIGHEVDTSLAELAADLRASTPSNAAELLVPDMQDVMQELRYLRSAIDAVLSERAALETSELIAARATLGSRVSELLRSAEQSIAAQKTLVSALDPATILHRGYALVRRGDGSVVRNASAVQGGDILNITLADGQLTTEVQ